MSTTHCASGVDRQTPPLGAPSKTHPANELSDDSSEASSLLMVARAGDNRRLGELLQQYRHYLTLLATTQIEKRLQPRVSPSDIVQETMLKAYRHFAQFRGQSEPEFRAWLRQILVSNLARFVEQYMLAAKRDIRREVPIEPVATDGDGNLTGLAAMLPGSDKTPSAYAQNREAAAELAQRLAQLPSQYREILVMRDIQGLSFEEVAARLGRSTGATRMLWLRALEKLRAAYRRAEQNDK